MDLLLEDTGVVAWGKYLLRLLVQGNWQGPAGDGWTTLVLVEKQAQPFSSPL